MRLTSWSRPESDGKRARHATRGCRIADVGSILRRSVAATLQYTADDHCLAALPFSHLFGLVVAGVALHRARSAEVDALRERDAVEAEAGRERGSREDRRPRHDRDRDAGGEPGRHANAGRMLSASRSRISTRTARSPLTRKPAAR